MIPLWLVALLSSLDCIGVWTGSRGKSKTGAADESDCHHAVLAVTALGNSPMEQHPGKGCRGGVDVTETKNRSPTTGSDTEVQQKYNIVMHAICDWLSAIEHSMFARIYTKCLL